MRKVIITSDSTCDLSKELIEKYDIKIVPLYINLGNNSYKDSLELTTKELYEKIEAKEGFPKTSATTPDDFYTMRAILEAKENAQIAEGR